MRIISFITLMCFGIVGICQSFDYNVTSESQPFELFFNGTKLNNAIWDDPTFEFATPFPIAVMGELYDRIKIASEGTGGSLRFSSSAGDEAFMSFSIVDIADRGLANPPKSQSSIRHRLTGAPGSYVLTLQYYNFGFFDPINDLNDGSDFMHVQIKFYEFDGAIEVCYGERNLPNYSRIISSTQGNTIAFFKSYNSDLYPDSVWYLKNDPAVPEIQFITNGQSFPLLWQNEPIENAVIRFMPSSVPIHEQEINFNTHFSAFVSGGELIIQSKEPRDELDVSLYGMDGKKIYNSTFEGFEHRIESNNLNPGIYVIALNLSDGIVTQKIYISD